MSADWERGSAMSADDDVVLTDAQLAIMAAYEDDGSEAWYHKPDFKALLNAGCGEFELMRYLSADLRMERAKTAGLVLAINEMLALPVAHATLHRIAVDALKNVGEWQT